MSRLKKRFPWNVAVLVLAGLACLQSASAPAQGADAQEITRRIEAMGKVSQGYAIGSSYTQAVERFHADNGTLPGSLGELNFDQGTPASVKEVRVEPDGIVEVYLTGHPYLEGGALTFTPTVNQDGTLSWKCGRLRIEAELVPIGCRQ
jgi:hypothetical protein